ncbi:hypothetical protein BY996DRAFT_7109348 [Phakopsora pachyrhizi]|nr:hypothetical protein BY996DRAFT_7109348 [Phakopsora pachyrhizi]
MTQPSVTLIIYLFLVFTVGIRTSFRNIFTGTSLHRLDKILGINIIKFNIQGSVTGVPQGQCWDMSLSAQNRPSRLLTGHR